MANCLLTATAVVFSVPLLVYTDCEPPATPSTTYEQTGASAGILTPTIYVVWHSRKRLEARIGLGIRHTFILATAFRTNKAYCGFLYVIVREQGGVHALRHHVDDNRRP
jgi:hypothetical protein